jgi:N-acetylglucosaminyldiphosphoundecaprenol N-acetyl-beta-D-mannosaminyltransferase
MDLFPERFKRYQLLGVSMQLLTIDDLEDAIAAAIATQQRWLIANHNLHSAYLSHRGKRFRRIIESAPLIHIDGMPLILLGRLVGLPFERRHRTTYADWVHRLMADSAQHGWRVFFLGSREGVAERAAEILRERYAGLQIATHHGYFDKQTDSAENQAVLQRIRDFRTDVLMVGLGMPLQEYWISDNLNDIAARAILPSGACMDYVAGYVDTPPRWMGAVGIEWAYRLVREPKRLWRRYLVEPWTLLLPFMRDVVRYRLRRIRP